MGLRKFRKTLDFERKLARQRFEHYRRLNQFSSCHGQFPLTIVLDHLKPSFNVGKIFRSADAFGIHEIHLIGIDYFDPAPSMGSFKWVPAVFHETFESCYEMLIRKEYSLYIMEPDCGHTIFSHDIPLKSAFIFGHEEFGISFDRTHYPLIHTLCIPQVGRVQSLNVSVAASITMYEYVRRHGTDRSIG